MVHLEEISTVRDLPWTKKGNFNRGIYVGPKMEISTEGSLGCLSDWIRLDQIGPNWPSLDNIGSDDLRMTQG